jgi:lipopolysaccharide/colanic/teichoic acid biosynthesis glycosyltransferase
VIAGARLLQPEAILLVMPWHDTDMIDRCVETLRKIPAEVHLGPEHILDRFEQVQLLRIGPISSLQLRRMPLSRLELLEKRALDLLLASAALLMLTPLLIAVAILIKLDSPGPVLFLQRRFGFNQKPFQIIKFRSMRFCEDGPVVRQAQKGDPRITRIGRWLRRWSVDEVPQLFNVIKGDMSLVRPRPHALSQSRIRAAHLDLCAPAQRQARHHRMGADPRIAGRNRHRRQDAPARRARPLLHRQLVGVARSADSDPHRDLPVDLPECVLSRTGRRSRALRRITQLYAKRM